MPTDNSTKVFSLKSRELKKDISPTNPKTEWFIIIISYCTLFSEWKNANINNYVNGKYKF